GKVLSCGAVRLSEDTNRRAEYMWFGMRSRLVDTFADAVDEISGTDSDGLDEQRRRAIPQVMKCPQIDPGIFVGITKHAVDKGCDGIAVGLRKLSHDASPPTSFAMILRSLFSTTFSTSNLSCGRCRLM